MTPDSVGRRNRRRREWLIAAVTVSLLAGCGGGLMPSIRSEPDRLKTARRMMDEHDYFQAIELLKTYVASNMGSADVDEALYLYGECALQTKDWATATVEFEKVLREYPESDSAAAASYGLGAAHYGQARPPDFDQDFTEKALFQWQSYLNNYPGHWRNAEAQRKIAEVRSRIAKKLVKTGNLYLKLNSWKPARVYFDRVDTEFNDTPEVADAWIGLALVDMKYGLKDRAVERLKQVETRFPKSSVAERAALERARIEH